MSSLCNKVIFTCCKAKPWTKTDRNSPKGKVTNKLETRETQLVVYFLHELHVFPRVFGEGSALGWSDFLEKNIGHLSFCAKLLYDPNS